MPRSVRKAARLGRCTICTLQVDRLKRESILSIAALSWAEGRIGREEAAGLVPE